MAAPEHFHPQRWAMIGSQPGLQQRAGSKGAAFVPPVQPRSFVAASVPSAVSTKRPEPTTKEWMTVMSEIASAIQFDPDKHHLQFDRVSGRVSQKNGADGPPNVILSDVIRFLERSTNAPRLGDHGMVPEGQCLYRLKKLVPASYLGNANILENGRYVARQNVGNDIVLLRGVITYIRAFQTQPILSQIAGSQKSLGSHPMLTRSQAQLLGPSRSTGISKNDEPARVKQEYPASVDRLQKLFPPKRAYQELVNLTSLPASTHVAQKRPRLQPKAFLRNPIEQALLKMNKWIETWYSGALGNTDIAWESFEQCLALPDIVEYQCIALAAETQPPVPFPVLGSNEHRGKILDDSSSDDALEPAVKRQKLGADHLPCSSLRDIQPVVAGINDFPTQVRGNIVAAKFGFKPATLTGAPTTIVPSSRTIVRAEISSFDDVQVANNSATLTPRIKFHIPETPNLHPKPNRGCGNVINDLLKLQPPVDRAAKHKAHANIHPLDFDKRKHLQGNIIDHEGDFRMHDDTFIQSDSEADATGASASCATDTSSRVHKDIFSRTSTKERCAEQSPGEIVSDNAVTEEEWRDLSTHLSDHSKHGLSNTELPSVNIPREINPCIRWPRPIPARIQPIQVVAETAQEYHFGVDVPATKIPDMQDDIADCARDMAGFIQNIAVLVEERMSSLDSDPVNLLNESLLLGHIFLLLAMPQ